MVWRSADEIRQRRGRRGSIRSPFSPTGSFHDGFAGRSVPFFDVIQRAQLLYSHAFHLSRTPPSSFETPPSLCLLAFFAAHNSASSASKSLPTPIPHSPSRRGVLCRTHPFARHAHTSPPFSSSSRLRLPLPLSFLLSLARSHGPDSLFSAQDPPHPLRRPRRRDPSPLRRRGRGETLAVGFE